MQQRQLRLGDTLDDYCPRERRLTTHAVVAMVGDDVKLVRCTGCDGEHEYKQGKVPRPRKKADTPAALFGQVAANAPKRVVHEPPQEPEAADAGPAHEAEAARDEVEAPTAAAGAESEAEPEAEPAEEEGPIHRRLIRASLPRPEGQPPPSRPNPEFTIHQPNRPGRFRPRHQRGGGGQPFFGNRSNGNVAGGQRGDRQGGGGRRRRGRGK